MKKYIHIVIAIILVSLSFIKVIHNYMIVIIIFQNINFVLLFIELKKRKTMKNDNSIKNVNKVNYYFLLVSLFISILVFLISKLSTNLSQKSIEIIICIIFIYSILFTIVVGLSLDKSKRNKENVLSYLLNAIIIALLCLFVVSLKTDTYINLINKQIDNLNYFMILAVLVKFVLDIIVAFNINFAI